ncbi:MAG: hypothetical protein BECKG1743F_GA0114225_109771, partial [Candidatus Kentron sp. G]
LLMTDLEILYKTMAKINKLRWSPALVEKVKAILRVDMLSTRGAVINSHLYYVGDELNERIPPLRGSRLPIPLYLEAISIKNKSAMIRIGKTGKVAEVPMVY